VIGHSGSMLAALRDLLAEEMHAGVKHFDLKIENGARCRAP